MDTSAHQSNYVNVNGIRLHYLDWGGEGPVLLFLTGLGSSAYVYNGFAPRFTDQFHVLVLTRRGHGDSDYPETGYDVDTLTEDVRQFLDALQIEKVILAGHSMANVELTHFAALYPERLLKLIYLDPSYDRTTPTFKSMLAQKPMVNITMPGINDDYYNMEDYFAACHQYNPFLEAMWGEVIAEDILHSVKVTPEGKIVDRASEAIMQGLMTTSNSYCPEYSKIKVPTLYIFAVPTAEYHLAPNYMTEEQLAQVVEFFGTIRPPLQRELVTQFERAVPHAKVVEINPGHHFCFIKQEEQVFEAMKAFLVS